MRDEGSTAAENSKEEGSSDTPGVEFPRSEGPQGRDDGGGPTGSGDQSRLGKGAGGSGSEGDEHRLRQRHRARVPKPQDVEDLEARILQGFASGNPEKAWEGVQHLLTLSKNLVREAAQERFKVNFGSDACSRCDGLRVGYGVTATCFQIRQCYYDNVKEGTAKQTKLVDLLSKKS